MSVRVGIAGCGLIAGAPLQAGRPIAMNHAAACRATPDCELVAAADPSQERREAFGSYWSLKSTFPTVDEMLTRERIDLVVVATPPETHLALCELAIARGVRAILCEKPLSAHAASAKRLVDACRDASVILAANFTRRWDTSHAELVRRVRDGELGTPRILRGTYTGTVRGNGTHLVDTIRMLLSSSLNIEWTRPLAPGSVDGAVAALLTASPECVIELSPVEGSTYFIFEIEFIGTKGRARTLLGGNDIRIDLPEPSILYPGYSYLTNQTVLPRDSLPHAFEHLFAALVAALTTSAPMPYDAAEHISTLAIVDALVDHAIRPRSPP